VPNGSHAQEAVASSSKPTTAVPAAPPASRIFAPFRALGYVCNDVPFAMHVHTPNGALAKQTIIVVTAVGRSWLMWDAASMRLLFVGTSDMCR
jgi:U3 small nucleolar RNA-associated protein 21